MNDFYLTLPSDSSMDLYPDNTLSTFRTHLNPTISFKHEEWEMGVASLSFPTEWYNLVGTDNKMSLKIQAWPNSPPMTTLECVGKIGESEMNCEMVRDVGGNSPEVETHLPTDNYITVEHLLKVMNVSLHELWKSSEVKDHIYRPPYRRDPDNKDLTAQEQSAEEEYQTRIKLGKAAEAKGPFASFKQDPRSKKVCFSFDHQEALNLMRMLPRISFQIEGPLVTMLGWNEKTKEIPLDQLGRQKLETKIEAPNQPQLQMAMDVFYLYSDIVEPQRVGDIMAPIVDVFRSESGYHRPSTIHYVPLKYDRMTTVGVYIRTGMGHPVPFVHGKVVVKLHFRKKQ